MPRSLEERLSLRNRFWSTFAALTLVAAGCSADVVCGDGTQKKQLANGQVACVAVDVTHGDTTCNADGGVAVVGGNNCVSTLQCGPGTVRDPASNQCVPAVHTPHEPDACTNTAGKICVNGTVRTFVDGAFLVGQSVHVAVYDPVQLLGGLSGASVLGEVTTGDTFTLANMDPPSMGVLLVVVTSPSGSDLAPAAIGGQVQAGGSIRVDPYALTAAQLSTWSSGGGANYAANGAVVFRMFNDPPPPAAARTPTETHPVTGGQLIDKKANAPPSDAKYFGATMAAIDGALSATGASGGVITGKTPTGGLYTGMGGGVTMWETHQAQVIPGLIQIDFLHPQ
jgi:hypothetical protein